MLADSPVVSNGVIGRGLAATTEAIVGGPVDIICPTAEATTVGGFGATVGINDGPGLVVVAFAPPATTVVGLAVEVTTAGLGGTVVACGRGVLSLIGT